MELVPHDVVIVIVFDGSKYSLHEILSIASQQYKQCEMEWDDSLFFRDEETFQIFIFYNDLPFEFMALGTTVKVSFNDRNLHNNLEGFTCLKLEKVKNTLYKQVLLHVWSHFFLDTSQANEAKKEIQERVYFMKFTFWDWFAKVEFTSNINMSVQNMKAFKYWIVNNCTVRLSHLQDMGLTWINTGKY